MDFYEKYKPFRNYMRGFDLVPSLIDAWRYSLHIMENERLPIEYGVGAPAGTAVMGKIHPWEIDILVKEIVLNARRHATHSLKNWKDLATAINHVRRLENEAYVFGNGSETDLLFDPHRLVHRQFPWQTKLSVNPMMRALKVFGDADVEAIIVRELGMTMRQFIHIGSAVGGHFRKNWGMLTTYDYTVLGISQEASAAFFDRITCTMEQLKAQTAELQTYDRDWPYTWNPLEATPLVRFDPAHPDRVLCPIPRYLARRTSAGIFYDVIRLGGFDNRFGAAFQRYVGEVTRVTCPAPRFTLLAEEPYHVGGNKMHGVDWILSDETGHLFIESKAKRLTLAARTQSNPAALNKDLAVMATAVVQHYRNIHNALSCKTRWVPDGLPIYPMVLTFEDWFILSPRVHEMLDEHVRRLLADTNLSPNMPDEMPYTIASSQEWEYASQVIAQAGIAPVMGKKTEPTHRTWSLLPFVNNEFKEEMRRISPRLFGDEFLALRVTAPTKLGPPGSGGQRSDEGC